MSEGALDQHKVAAARLWAASNHPYLAAALFAQQVVARPGLGTAAVDEGWRFYVDPAMVGRWSIEQLGSLMVHHTGHLVRDHAGRARALGIDEAAAGDWARATDAEINDDLVTAGLRLPGEPILPQTIGCRPGRLAEEYYHHDHHDPPGIPDCGSASDGRPRRWEMSGLDSGGLPPGEQHLIRCQVAAEVLANAREGVGRIPAGLRRWAEELLEPAVDWRQVLAAEIRRGVSREAGCVDYTYRRPSRRASACPTVILPALEKPVPDVAIVCDTSGSMREAQLARVLTEVESLLRGVGLARTRVRVVTVDAAVHTVRAVSRASQIELVGGGGTDVGAGLQAAVRLRPRPAVVVVLTDGMTPWPAAGPKGVQVVVGLIAPPPEGRGGRTWDPPAWARVVHIDE